jgi:hypothetical protein
MKFAKTLILICSAFVIAACDSDSSPNNDIDEEFFALQVLHASSDAPAVNVYVDGVEVLSDVDYKDGSAQLGLSVREQPYNIRVDGILPGGDVTVIGPADLDFAADTVYTIAAVNGVADIEPVVISQPDVPVTAGSARLFVLHATPGAAPDFSLPVDVYVDAYSEPNAPVGTSAPLTFDFKETLGPIEVAAGDYQVRVTLSGTETVVYDSGLLPLVDGDDLTLAAVPNVSGGPAAVSLVALTGGGSAEFADVNTPTGLRVGHLSPDTPDVDVVVNGGVYLADVPFPAVTDIAALPADTYNVAVQAAGNPGVVPIGPVDLALEAGTWYSVLAVDFFNNIEPLILTDDARPVATNAKVRIVHASPTAQDVDIYLTAPEAGIADVEPTLPSVPFKANTGYLALAEGDYDVTVTLPGTKDIAIGPATISIANGGVYTAIARDPLPGQMEFGLIVLADTLVEDN